MEITSCADSDKISQVKMKATSSALIRVICVTNVPVSRVATGSIVKQNKDATCTYVIRLHFYEISALLREKGFPQPNVAFFSAMGLKIGSTAEVVFARTPSIFR